jgi:hypothetical protein
MTADPRASGTALLPALALTAFTGAALFMQLQPLVARVLLPQLGGAPGVWVSCLAFFQLTLCAGYLAVHLAFRWLSLSRQLAAQVLLVVACTLLGPLSLPPMLAAPEASPAGHVLFTLFGHVALAAFVLSCTAPLLQAWYAAIGGERPYVLYALSNAGSLLGLLSYPLVVEHWFDLHTALFGWRVAFAAYVGLMLLCAVLVSCAHARGRAPARVVAPQLPAPRSMPWLMWGALSAAPSALLAAITNYISVDVPASPLLWVAPLALYLASFVVAFGRDGALSRAYGGAWIACTIALAVLVLPGNEARLPLLLGAPLATLWVGSMICHSELVRLRPEPIQLTAYYAVIAGGGALGGGLVAFAAPNLFVDHYELMLSILAVHGLQMLAARRTDRRVAPSGAQRMAWLGFGLALPVLVAVLFVQVAGLGRMGHVLARSRNFFGPLQVLETSRVRVLAHGRTDQGQALLDPAHSHEPVGYVGADTGVGRAMRLHARGRARSLGVVGLGVGALAAYTEPGDRLRFYELNPAVEPLARRFFPFLNAARARTTVVSGDGRLALLAEPARSFDVLVIDAFSSDGVPMHLLTLEAFRAYERALVVDGVLVINVSSRHFQLERVVAGSARATGMACAVLDSPAASGRGLTRARWALVARSLASLEILRRGDAHELAVSEPVLWTDAHSSLLDLAR